MAATALLSFTIITAVVCIVSSAPVDLEADMFEESIKVVEKRTRDRQNAANGRNIWLKGGESLMMTFCLDIESYVSIKNIYWSNDGWLDTVIVTVDGQGVGNFSTNDNSDWGNLWNTFYESGPIGEELDLTSGEHTLTLEVPEADSYGVEIDKVVFEVDGEVPDSGLTCERNEPDDNMSANHKSGEDNKSADDDMSANDKSGEDNKSADDDKPADDKEKDDKDTGDEPCLF